MIPQQNVSLRGFLFISEVILDILVVGTTIFLVLTTLFFGNDYWQQLKFSIVVSALIAGNIRLYFGLIQRSFGLAIEMRVEKRTVYY